MSEVKRLILSTGVKAKIDVFIRQTILKLRLFIPITNLTAVTFR